MFIIPCKYFDGCWIESSVEAIRKYHPNAKILVVDSDSSDKSYFEKVRAHGAEVADIANKNYEIGAFWYAVKNYQEDRYVLMQDSIIYKQSIQDIIDSTDMYTAFMYFMEPSFGNFNNIPTEEWVTRVNEFLGDFMHLPVDRNVNYLGTFGSNFIASRAMIELMLEKGLDKVFLPQNKADSWVSERVCGIVGTQAGANLLENSFYPEEYHELKNKGYNSTTEVLSTDRFDKIYCYRK